MKVISVFLFSVILFSFHASAQYKTQTLKLHSGWNAVFFEVQPTPADCETVFSGMPVESVWAWNRKFNSIQFVQDPNTMFPGQPEWLTWFPKDHPKSFLNNLFSLGGEKAYLIKVENDTPEITLTLKGKAQTTKKQWYPNSYNLAGFNVDKDNLPAFSDYFSGSIAHSGQPVYKMNAEGEWELIANSASEKIENGIAYWVKCKGVSDFSGPIEASFLGSSSIEFGEKIVVAEVAIQNKSKSEKTISVRIINSATPPAGEEANAGNVPISYWHTDFENQKFQWKMMPAQLNKTIKAGGKWTQRFMVRRNDMPESASPSALFQNLLEIEDGTGAKIYMPMTAEKALDSNYPGGPTPFPRNGLWVGYAILNKVSMAHGTSTPQPTSAPLSFRIIVHQDSNGIARLLQKATVMMKKSDTTNLVVITNDKLIPQFLSDEPSDDSVEGQRFSSVVFGMREPEEMSYNQEGKSLSANVFIGYDDPLNPFKHLYHPDHNNLENYEKKLPEGVQSFDVTREITMSFSAEPVKGASAIAWGDTVVGGVYNESIDGLYHTTLNVQGRFVLNQVTDAAELYMGQ
ncbi:hypothetical protein KAH27_06920 [bacterium]|nr:hypothetical protein [bacterium]